MSREQGVRADFREEMARVGYTVQQTQSFGHSEGLLRKKSNLTRINGHLCCRVIWPRSYGLPRGWTCLSYSKTWQLFPPSACHSYVDIV